MSIKHTLILFLIFYAFFLTYFCNSSFKKKSSILKNRNKLSNKYKKEKIREKIHERKLQDNDEDFPFVPLSIYIDKEEFKHTIPDELKDYEGLYLNAMDDAAKILEDFLEIQTDKRTTYGKRIDTNNYVSDNYGIEHYTDVFREEYLSVEEYNFYILSKFISEIGEESASVILDDFAGAPIVGIVLFNNNIDNLDKNKLTPDYLTTLMLHHFIRLLGFNAELSNIYLPTEKVNGEDIYYLKTEDDYYDFTNVINYAKKYFNCPTIDRIDLFVDDENLDADGDYYQYCGNDIIGLYWPKRLFLGELLTKFDYPEEQFLSGFTLAFLDDLPYLHVTKDYMGGSLRFGKNKDCDFFNKHCGDSGNLPSTFANEFFIPNNSIIIQKPSCSSGRLSKTIYKLQAITEDEQSDPNTEYFLNLNAGPKSTNYCPIAQYDYSSTDRYIYSGRCSETEKTEKNIARNEELGGNSFCVLSSLEKTESSSNPETEPEILALCYEMYCSSKSLTIKIGEYYIVCPREGGKIKAKYFNGYLLCPDYNLICSNKPLCNNLLDCLELKSKENEESFNYDDYGENNEIKTTQNSTIYETAPRDYGWELTTEGSCPYLCMQCTSSTNCIRCEPHYNYINSECIYAIEHCAEFEDEENDICTKCDDHYFLVQNTDGSRYCETGNKDQFYLFDVHLEIYKRCEIENCNKCLYASEFETKVKCSLCNSPFVIIDEGNGQISCQNVDISKYYPIIEGDITYYKKCENAITNCDECSAQNHCTKCKTNFGIANNDHTQCVYLLDEKYYYDTTLETFKLCSNKMLNCELCTNNDDFICKKCFINYSFKHDNNNIECAETSSLEGNNYYYTNDSKVNYYSCQLYNSVINCVQCSNQVTCENCQSGYELHNENKLCAKTIDIQNNIYIWTNGDILIPCSSLIEDCHQCTDSSTCNSCEEEAALTNEHKCISKTSIEENKNYYRDETGIYFSCSMMANCVTCDSGTVCTSCQNGFRLNNNICISENSEDKKVNLSTGEIIGIVLGCIGFLLLAALLIYFLLNKFFRKNDKQINNIGENDKIKITEKKKEDFQQKEESFPGNDNQNKADIFSTKRNIHNKKKS